MARMIPRAPRPRVQRLPRKPVSAESIGRPLGESKGTLADLPSGKPKVIVTPPPPKTLKEMIRELRQVDAVLGNEVVPLLTADDELRIASTYLISRAGGDRQGRARPSKGMDTPFASQTQAENAIAAAVSMNPANVKQQIDFRLATEAEDQAGTNDEKLTTPLGVQRQVRIYGTLALAAAAAIPSTVPRVTVLRYDSNSHFSPAEYVWQLADPGHALKFAGATGFFVLAGGRLNAWAAGLRTTASDNADAFQRIRGWAIVQATAFIHIPGGLYVSGGSVNNTVFIMDFRELFDDHVITFQGDGPGKTIIKSIAGAANVGALSLKNVNHFTWRGITFDGNYDNATSDSRHGLRSEGVSDLTYDDFECIECRGYPLGLQGDEGDGGHIRVRITNGVLRGGNRDACDIKNRDSLNHDIMFSNLVISEYSRVEATSSAVDVRGPATLSDIHIIRPANSHGIQLRPDSDASAQVGGRYSQVNNIIIDCGGLTGAGIVVEHAYANLSNITIYGFNASLGYAAVYTGADCTMCNLSNITVKASADAAPGYGYKILTGIVNLSNCHYWGDNGGGTGFYFETNSFSCVNCSSQQNGGTFTFQSTVAGGNGSFVNCKSYGDTSLHADDAWVNCFGFPSRSKLPIAFTPNFADDAAAVTANVPIGSFYRIGNDVRVRSS